MPPALATHLPSRTARNAQSAELHAGSRDPASGSGRSVCSQTSHLWAPGANDLGVPVVLLCLDLVAAARGQAAHDVTHVLLGGLTSTSSMGLEKDRIDFWRASSTPWSRLILKAAPESRPVVGAVDEGHLDVDHGVKPAMTLPPYLPR